MGCVQHVAIVHAVGGVIIHSLGIHNHSIQSILLIRIPPIHGRQLLGSSIRPVDQVEHVERILEISMANWIQGAIKHPGALTKKAKAEGESPMGFAKEHENSKGTTGKQARLAMILQGLRKAH